MTFEHGAYRATYHYTPISLTGFKRLKCTGCGKTVRRQKTFTQTMNPFNKNAEGKPASRAEIMDKLRLEVAEWEQKEVTCSWCAESE